MRNTGGWSTSTKAGCRWKSLQPCLWRTASAIESPQHCETLVDKDIELVTHVDPSILGGLVLRVEDKLIDGSTRARLQRLRRNMTTTGV